MRQVEVVVNVPCLGDEKDIKVPMQMLKAGRRLHSMEIARGIWEIAPVCRTAVVDEGDEFGPLVAIQAGNIDVAYARAIHWDPVIKTTSSVSGGTSSGMSAHSGDARAIGA